jgi:hypothetical protein
LPSPEARDFALTLIHKAEQDEVVLAKLLEDPDIADEILGLHLQQAVEKRLKAVLAFNEVDFKRTHNLGHTLTELERNEIELPGSRDQIVALTPWAGEARYEEWFDGPLDRPAVMGLLATVGEWSERLVGATDWLSSHARVLTGFVAHMEFDHIVLVVEREHESLVLHVTEDQSAWVGQISELTVALFVRAIDMEGSEDVSDLDPAEPKTVQEALTSIVRYARVSLEAKQALLLIRSSADFSFMWWHATSDRILSGDAFPDSLSRVLLDIDEAADLPMEPGMFEKPVPDVRVSGGTVMLTDREVEFFKKQEQLFREKFGRDPGPEDPIFFDPAADEPRPLPQEQIEKLEMLTEEFGASEISKQVAAAKIKAGMAVPIDTQDAVLPGNPKLVPMLHVLRQALALVDEPEKKCLFVAVHCWAEGHLAAPGHPEPDETEVPFPTPPYPDPADPSGRLNAIVDEALTRFDDTHEIDLLTFTAALAWRAGIEEGADCQGCAVAGASDPVIRAARSGELAIALHPLLDT